MTDPVGVEPEKNTFGSSHAGGWLVAFCDGSTRAMSYELNPETHRRLGNRQDGENVSAH
jgi:hypothetical protein